MLSKRKTLHESRTIRAKRLSEPGRDGSAWAVWSCERPLVRLPDVLTPDLAGCGELEPEATAKIPPLLGVERLTRWAARRCSMCWVACSC